MPFRLHLFFCVCRCRPSIIFFSFMRHRRSHHECITFLSLQSMPLYRSYILPRSFSTKKKIAEKCGGKLLFYSQASNFLNFVHALLPFFISSKSFFFALVFVFAPSSCLILSLSMRLCCVPFENCSMANEKCTRRKGKKEGVNATHNSSSEEK